MKLNSISKFFIAVIGCELAGAIGTSFTISAIPTWYATLTKPALNPPNFVFGPIWATLYLLMGIATFIIWKKGVENTEVHKALKIFLLQLFFNAIWSIIFFGLENPFMALIDILLMLFLIIWTMFLFYRISRPAMYLLLPYLLWVSFATYLNYSIWILN